MFAVGAAILLVGVSLIVRGERAAGFKHLWDRKWLENDLSASPLVAGTTATFLKYLSRVVLVGGAVVMVVGAATRSWSW